MKCLALLLSVVSATRLARKGCDCTALLQEPQSVLLPPEAPPPLPPMPPAALPPMPTYTRMTEADLPTLGPPPPTTTMSTTLRPPPGLFAAPDNPAQMQVDMMNGAFDHHFHYVPGNGRCFFECPGLPR